MLHFSLRVLPSTKPQAIISVSKKVTKSAVTRNLVKRRVRAALRPFMPTLRPGVYMLIARTGSQEVKGEALRQELAQLLKIS